MKTKYIKIVAITFFAIPLLLLAAFQTTPVKVAAKTMDDPAAVYKAKCAACHTPTASKFFDATKKDADLTQIVLKGKKGEKPPYMPGFEAKGMTELEATALVCYMKTLKPAAN